MLLAIAWTFGIFPTCMADLTSWIVSYHIKANRPSPSKLYVALTNIVPQSTTATNSIFK